MLNELGNDEGCCFDRTQTTDSRSGYNIVADTKGTLLWKSDDQYEKPHIILMSEQVSTEYLAYLDGIWSMAALAGVAMGPAFITVIGQCMGSGDTDAADYYFEKLNRITLLLSSAWNLLIFLLTPLFLMVYALEPETKRLVIWLVLIHNVFNAAAFPFSSALSNGLRAAGDVKYTMVVSVVSTLAVRLFLSWLLGIVFDMGVIGIAIAMVCDWVIRAVVFFRRLKSGKWKKFQVIRTGKELSRHKTDGRKTLKRSFQYGNENMGGKRIVKKGE